MVHELQGVVGVARRQDADNFVEDEAESSVREAGCALFVSAKQWVRMQRLDDGLGIQYQSLIRCTPFKIHPDILESQVSVLPCQRVRPTDTTTTTAPIGLLRRINHWGVKCLLQGLENGDEVLDLGMVHQVLLVGQQNRRAVCKEILEGGGAGRRTGGFWVILLRLVLHVLQRLVWLLLKFKFLHKL